MAPPTWLKRQDTLNLCSTKHSYLSLILLPSSPLSATMTTCPQPRNFRTSAFGVGFYAPFDRVLGLAIEPIHS
jgi:hypothetical protein